MRTLFFGAVLVVLCAPALASPVLDVTEMDNGDGSFTYWFEIDTLPEIAFLDLTIMGNLHQVQAHSSLYEQFGPSWAPNVVFTSDVYTSDAQLASAFDPAYAAAAHLDTVIDDTWWLGKIEVDLTPNDGNEFDGTSQVHVAMVTIIMEGYPLPGGFIPLAHVTTWGRNLWVQGQLQSESDPEGFFEWHVPEPSGLLLGVMGVLGIMATRRRRRSECWPK